MQELLQTLTEKMENAFNSLLKNIKEENKKYSWESLAKLILR